MWEGKARGCGAQQGIKHMVQKALLEPLQVCSRSRGKGSGWSFVFPVTVLGGNPRRRQVKSHFPSYSFQPSSTFQYPLHLAGGTSSDLSHPQMRCSLEERSQAGKSPTSRSHGLTAGPAESGDVLASSPAGVADPAGFCCRAAASAWCCGVSLALLKIQPSQTSALRGAEAR